jgi:hypothetical protein
MQSWKGLPGRRKALVLVVALAVLVIGLFFAVDRIAGDEAATSEPTRAQEEPREVVRPTGRRLELGTVAKISPSYSVSVTGLSLYEGDDTQFLAATIRAEYLGTSEGEPWADLSVEFADARGRTSGESSCPRSLEEGSNDALATGETTTHVACISLANKVIKGGRLYVEEALAMSHRTAWSTDEAELKQIPDAEVDDAPIGAGPAPRFNTPSGGGGSRANYEKVCEKYEDDVKEYRDGIDELDEIAEKYEDNPKYEDDLEEFEEWKDTMEANIDRYEAVCD